MKSMQIVATLDEPIQPGKNVIWCATFQAAWKKFQLEALGEVPRVEGAPSVCDRLNKAPDPTPDLPKESYYVTAEICRPGTFDRIRADMKRLFPDAPAPDFAGAVDDYVLYCYLSAHVPFTLAYFPHEEPLGFRSSSGQITPVRAFGISRQHGEEYRKLHGQVGILYASSGSETPGSGKAEEFVVDLCLTSQPNQVIVACVKPGNTLEETFVSVEQRIASANPDDYYFSPGCELAVPEMLWRVVHRYTDLETKQFLNTNLPNLPVLKAQQTIEFRLDRFGAEVKSEAMLVPAAAPPSNLICDRPFLLYIRKRGAKCPFLAIWVDNAEVLREWPD